VYRYGANGSYFTSREQMKATLVEIEDKLKTRVSREIEEADRSSDDGMKLQVVDLCPAGSLRCLSLSWRWRLAECIRN